MDNRNTLACSNAVLEEYFDKSRSTIQRATKTLVEGGFVAKFKVGNSSVYTVNPDLAWTDKRTNKKFSKYDGNILVSKKESLDYFHSENYEKFKSYVRSSRINSESFVICSCTNSSKLSFTALYSSQGAFKRKENMRYVTTFPRLIDTISLAKRRNGVN